jgi:hypothetical protein
VNALKGDDTGIIIVGGTWQQLGRLAEKDHQDSEPTAEWFDLLVIDEAITGSGCCGCGLLSAFEV